MLQARLIGYDETTQSRISFRSSKTPIDGEIRETKPQIGSLGKVFWGKLKAGISRWGKTYGMNRDET